MSDESDENDTDAGEGGSPAADRPPSDSSTDGPDADPGPADDAPVEGGDSTTGGTAPDADDTSLDADGTEDPDAAADDDLEPGTLHRVDEGPDRPPDARDADPTPEAPDDDPTPDASDADPTPDARDDDPDSDPDSDSDSGVEFSEQDEEDVPERVRGTPSPGDLIDDSGDGGSDPMSATAEPAGHGAAGGATSSPVVDQGDEEVGGVLGGHEEKPPDDEEMPLADHIEEMVKRLAVVVIAVALATAIAFPFATEVLNTMWYDLLPPDTPAPHLYNPLEKVLSEIKVASLAGTLVALPVLVYEAYLFMRPGLYPKERRYFLSAVPTSLVLGVIGMAFAYFLVLPVLFDYFIVYSKSGVDKLAFSLRVTFDLIVALLGAFAFVFQIPLLIMLAIMMGVTTRRWLESRRIYFWAGFLGLGFLMGGADLTGMAPIIIAATMVGLFEGTLALLRWTGKG